MVLSDYQDKWTEDFEAIKSVIIDANQGLKVEIEHIGSTAIPGLSAKPIIDIDLVYYSTEDYTSIKVNLESIDFYHNGNQGIEGREVFKRISEGNHPILDSIKHHLYVCHEGSDELKRHLLFRDKLRKDKELAKEYEELKLQLAAKANQDRKVYAELKESEAKALFEKILK